MKYPKMKLIARCFITVILTVTVMLMETLPRNEIIQKEASAHAHMKEMSYSNCCFDIRTAIKSTSCKRNRIYI